MKNIISKINRALATKKTKLFTLFFALVSIGTICTFSSCEQPTYAHQKVVMVKGIYYKIYVGEAPNYFKKNYPPGTSFGFASVMRHDDYKKRVEIIVPESFVYWGMTYNITQIGEAAFSCCSGLTSIEIPNSVGYIRERAFYGCTGLTSITIPDGVTSIEYETFSGCSGLTSIEMPNTVTSIGTDAFSGCSGLTSIEMPNTVTSIGYWAFNRCSGLTSITIPNSVTSIGDYAFYNCRSLTSIKNHAAIPQTISSSVFDGVDKSSCKLYVPEESIDLYKAADVWKDFGSIVAISE